jgi:hypothetical protein
VLPHPTLTYFLGPGSVTLEPIAISLGADGSYSMSAPISVDTGDDAGGDAGDDAGDDEGHGEIGMKW